MRTHMRTQTILGLLMVGLALANARGAVGDVARPTPYEIEAIANTLGSRLWYYEEEFLGTPSYGPDRTRW
jgi:hypothetical protein